MTRIVVLGGTGYAGRHIVAEAVSRGHEVVAVSRSLPSDQVIGAEYVQGSALDLTPLADTLTGADAVVSALSPRGDMTDRALEAVTDVAELLSGTSTRLGVVGGAGGSLVAAGGPRLFDQTDAGLDWFFVHPAEVFGPWAEGERTGHYRDGGDVLVRDAEGKSYISGADFAVAVVDEIEQGNHHRERFTVGY
ncbi:MAG: NAD(P)H-binding protein [Microbacterium sp.]|uniref:NAD(P)-dependent oxidoreductase n=1 Tax=Microbacterium sp. TaxID=51671 RepID=UPI001DF916A2|nr:NAD(P)H-binding protein [Microbacterium sp.]MBW8764399.1 NAD(P)H-binding protein [Microbacterium sp.]